MAGMVYGGVAVTPEMQKLIDKRNKFYDENIAPYEGQTYKTGGVSEVFGSKGSNQAIVDAYNTSVAEYSKMESELQGIVDNLSANKKAAKNKGIGVQTKGSALVGGGTEQSVLTSL